MRKYKPTLIERETIILFNERESEAEIYTYNQKLISRLKRYPTVVKLIRRDDTGAYTFRLPKKHLAISVRKPLSEEQKEILRERAKQLHKQGLSSRISENNASNKG